MILRVSFILASRKPILNEEYKETEFIKTNILGTTIYT